MLLKARGSIAAAALWLASGTVPLEAGVGELGILGGLQITHEVFTGNDETRTIGYSAGVRGGWSFTPRWGWIADGLVSAVDTDRGGPARTTTLRTAVDFTLNPGRRFEWFATGGAGLMDVDFDRPTAEDFDRFVVSAAIGQRVRTGGAWAHWELRGDQTLGHDGLDEARYSQGQFLVGLTWGRAGRAVARERDHEAPGDADGDGIVDPRDHCPGTAAGAPVDRRGCPPDADRDGVWDGLDLCAGTPPGAPVDTRGCLSDGDGDGVADGKDACPDTPRGALIDAGGCPIDSDGDDVPEGLDLCPGTPRGATVDVNGCHRDGDLDGVPDGLDACPDTPSNLLVDSRGCPRDSDRDGVPDGLDDCPGTTRGTTVGPDGCPQR